MIILSVRYLQIEDENHGEYYALMLFATVGMMFMASGYDLIVQFLGLETMALSFYVLAGFLRRDKRSNEGAVKYLLLGAFSSAILAYGFSILYGIGAMANLSSIGQALPPRTNLDVIAGRGGGAGPYGPVRASGARYGGCGAFLQGRRRAVSPVGAGRVRGRSDADHGLHQRGVANRELRPAAAPAAHRVLAGARRLGDAASRAWPSRRSRLETSRRSRRRT